MLRIRVLGTPSLEARGEPIRLEGRKTWALLTYLLLESRPPTRREMVDRLWSDADDPLGAARWALSQVRKALAGSAAIVEREGRLVLDAEVPMTVDAQDLLAGRWDPSGVDELVRGELLESWDFDETPEFARWLGVQRTRLASAATYALRTAASLLARSAPERALSLAERGLVADPFDDALHALIVEIHMLRGDAARARRYADEVSRRYREDLGAALPELVAKALDVAQVVSPAVRASHGAQAEILLSAADARGKGGDFAGGRELALRAAGEAAASGDAGMEARALASATNYATHGGVRPEAMAMLQRAARLATEAGDKVALNDVERERGRIAGIMADLGAAEAAHQRALAIAIELGDGHRTGVAHLFLGIGMTERCDYERAEINLRAALEGHRRPGLVMAWLARLLVRTERYDEAEDAALKAIALMNENRDTLQLALALVQCGDVQLARGDHAAAIERFAEAFTVGQTIGDKDGIALALRGLALVDHREGRPERARQGLREALTHSASLQRRVEVEILTDLVELEKGADPALVERGLRIAVAAPFPDLAERLARFAGSHTPVHTVAP
jgi:DNA-binding SARP family transcriptional activator/predicted negative regulator of RcsB-dependent stress response